MAQPPPPSSDPSTESTALNPLVNISCLDLLLIELVPMAYRITADLALREEEWMHGSASRPKRHSGMSNDASSNTVRTDGGPVGGAGGTATVDDEEAREAVFHRLEGLGYRVGLGIVEKCVNPILITFLPREIGYES